MARRNHKPNAGIIRKIRNKASAQKKKTLAYFFDRSFLQEEDHFDFAVVEKLLEELLEIVRIDSVDKHALFFEKFLDLFLKAYAPDRRAKHRIHPSSFQKDCLRKVYYEVSRTPETDEIEVVKDATLYKIFAIGTFWHTLIQAHLKRMGVLLKSEVKVISRAKYINGKGDGVLLLEGNERLIEIKTIATMSFWKLAEPLESHKYQASIYADILGLPEIHFVYVEKNFGNFKEYVIRPDKFLLKEAYDKIGLVRSHKRQGVPPHRACKTSDEEQALSCPFRTQCFTHDKFNP